MNAERFQLREGPEEDLPALVRVDGGFSNEWVLYMERRGGPAEQTIELRWRKVRPDGSRRGFGEDLDPDAESTLEDIARDYQRSDRVVVAEAGGRIAGFLMLGTNWNRTAELTAIIVDRAYRRRGLGRQFVEEAAAYARQRELRALQWEVQNDNRNAIEFAVAQGFRIAGFNDAFYRNRDHERQLAPDFRGLAIFLTRELD